MLICTSINLFIIAIINFTFLIIYIHHSIVNFTILLFLSSINQYKHYYPYSIYFTFQLFIRIS